jgi:hypothetical protein
MTDNLPDYMAMEPPEDTDPSEFTTHERRADLLRQIINAGSPFAINQSHLATDRYGVARSTVSRDMDRLREVVDDQLGRDAKLTARSVFEHVLGDLLQEENWRAKARAFDIMMEWNEWLADLGEQHREPHKSAVDVDMRTRHSEMSYQIVREVEDEPLPTTKTANGDGVVDYEALGFSASPAEIPAEIETKTDADRSDPG